jgi:hypothetical protein
MSIQATKRRIFISAHPVDRYQYLEPIVAAIESTGSCTAVYNPVPADGLPSLPEGIDTVVVVASLKYFVWAGSGYASELAAAIRDGIPVIPFLIENTQNVIDLVNMRCGKLQYIDAVPSPAFALDTLCAHLVAEEREVDRSLPSVFISYRRADKPYLCRLVDTICSSPSFGQINLWYDEVIAPGENYSLSILREIRECNLFILLVTPRILEPSNYVFRVEFKEARALRKHLLAVEAERTDKRALSALYGPLGHIADLKHPDAIRAVIEKTAALYSRSK